MQGVLMYSRLFSLPRATRGTLRRPTLAFRCEGVVPGFHVQQGGDKTQTEYLDAYVPLARNLSPLVLLALY